MQVAELIALLEDYPEDAEVRLAIQPNYPFQHTIAQVISTEELGGNDGDECATCGGMIGLEEATDDADPCECDEPTEEQVVVYIAEAGQHRDAPYLPGNVAAELGWR